VGLSGVEPLTSRLSGVRSNHLSYRPYGSLKTGSAARCLRSHSGQSSRKEVIQPHVPVRLPCYDFAPVTGFTLSASAEAPSGAPGSHGVTGGVYKARERIHRAVLMRDY
jgi:hypothetical protein